MAAVLLALFLSAAPPFGHATESSALVYRGGGQGRVVFDGQGHASKGIVCAECHTDYLGTGKRLFSTRTTGLIGFEDHNTETKCFACHNGKKVFSDCTGCHRLTS